VKLLNASNLEDCDTGGVSGPWLLRKKVSESEHPGRDRHRTWHLAEGKVVELHKDRKRRSQSWMLLGGGESDGLQFFSPTEEEIEGGEARRDQALLPRRMWTTKEHGGTGGESIFYVLEGKWGGQGAGSPIQGPLNIMA